MIWADRQRTDGTLRKFIDSNGNEQNVHIEEIEANIMQNGTPVNSATMNLIEKNIGTYGEDTYDNTATYQEGDIVTHNALLYRAKQDISTAEEWTASHWEQTNALEQITSAGGNEIVIGDISDVTNKTKLLIETDTMETLGTEVVDTLEGNERNRAPSVNAVKDKLVNVGTEVNNNFRTNILKGKNLANNILTTQTVSGVTITKNDNDTLTLNGTASATFTKTIAIINLKSGKTYTLSGGEGLTRETVSLDMRVSEAGNLYGGNWYIPVLPTVTIANDITLYLTIRIQSGATFTNKVISPMLEEGSTATTYESYITPVINVDGDEIYNQNISNYSTDEQRIGTWIDGKPLYRKVYNIPETTISSSTATQISISSDANIIPIDIRGFIGFATSNTYYPISGTAFRNNTGFQIRWTANNGLIQLIVDTSMSAESKVKSSYVVVEYTKTTD